MLTKTWGTINREWRSHREWKTRKTWLPHFSKSDSIKVNKVIFPKSIDRLCLLINKPKGFTCSNSDTFAKRLIFDLLEEEHKKQRLFCAGRLDVESEGLVILTNDGDLTYKLTHPSQRIEKKYEVELNKPLIENDRFKLMSGIEDKEDFLRLDKIEKRGKHGDSKRLFISRGMEKKRFAELFPELAIAS